MDLVEYNRLKEDADRLQREADRAEGELIQLKRRLKVDYGCDTIADARRLLKDLVNQTTKAEKQYEAMNREFRSRWENILKE